VRPARWFGVSPFGEVGAAHHVVYSALMVT
jgi:hypothetical protein